MDNNPNHKRIESNEALLKSNKTKVALLGGSFDPPTIAHIQIACELYNNFSFIDEVWLIPCGDGRLDKTLRTPGNHRLNMLNLIKEDLIPPSFPLYINKTELEKGEYVPTYYLLKELKLNHPDKEFYFCIGTDLLSGLKTWTEAEKLINECHFIIIPRENYSLTEVKSEVFPRNYKVLETIISGSSTNIRNRIHSRIEEKLNLAINGLTTQRVIKYIQEHNLYSLATK